MLKNKIKCNKLINQLLKTISKSEINMLAYKLVSIPSHSEVGTEEAAKWLYEFASKEGLPVRIQSTYRASHFNVLIAYPSLNKNPDLLLLGHLDTVPPFLSATIRKNILFGRGAADMKGGIAAMIMTLIALKRGQFPLEEKTVMVAAVAGEEIGGFGSKTLLSEVKPAACVVGEPTCLRIVTAHKGVEWIEIVVEGRSAHASSPWLGVNSISCAAAIVRALEELARRWEQNYSHPLLGKPTFNIGVIYGGVAPNIVPEKCVIRADRRWLPGENLNKIYEDIQKTVSHAVQSIKGINIQIKRMDETLHCVPMETPIDCRLVREIQQVFVEEGLPAKVQGVSYGTDGSLFAAQGIPTVILGPGNIAQAHSKNEYINLKEIWIAVKIYLHIVIHFLYNNPSCKAP
ncbi:MAG: M20 family metallopeptidase [Thermoproteota archaeon]